MITIPLKSGSINSHQIFYVQLGDNFLEFRLNYITRFPGWSLDLYKEGVLLIAGAMLVSSEDIVKNFNADIGRLLFVGEDPTIDNLGSANKLVWEDG